MGRRPDTEREIPVARPSFDSEEERLIREVLRSGWVTQGPRVAEFEREYAAAVGAEEAVAVSSATTALFLCLHALGIGPGDEVIVPSLSFIASANAITHSGASPVFVDVDPRTYNLDPGKIPAAIGPRTRAVMVVHQLGMPAELERIEQIARGAGLLVVEDAACAVGSRYKGRPIGGSGNPSCFSFHPRKVLVTGEGGMITTGNSELAARLRRLRHQGMSLSDLDRHRARRLTVEEYPEVGYNFRLSDLHAAVGLAQLRKLDRFLAARRARAADYEAALRTLKTVEPPWTPDQAETNFQSYIVRLSGVDGMQRDRVLDGMIRRGVSCRRGLMATHEEPCYRGARIGGSLRHTTAAAAQTIVLPMYVDLTADDVSHVVDQLREVLHETLPAAGNEPAADEAQP